MQKCLSRISAFTASPFGLTMFNSRIARMLMGNTDTLLLLQEANMEGIGTMTVTSVGRPLRGVVHTASAPLTTVIPTEKTAIGLPLAPEVMRKQVDAPTAQFQVYHHSETGG